MGVDHGFDHRPHQHIERRRRMLEKLGFDQAVDLLDVALVQGNKYRALVGEILIDGADTDASHFSDTVCRDGGTALALEQPDDGIEHGVDGLMGSALLGPAAERKFLRFWFCCHRSEHIINVSIIHIYRDIPLRMRSIYASLQCEYTCMESHSSLN